MSAPNARSGPRILVPAIAACTLALAEFAAAQQAEKVSSYALPQYVNKLICLTAWATPMLMAMIVIVGGLLYVLGGAQSRSQGKKLITGALLGFLLFVGMIEIVFALYPYVNMDNCVKDEVNNKAPIADARVSYKDDPLIYKFTYVTIGNTAYFDGSRSYDPDGTVTGHKWDLGDGTNLITAKAEHVYRDEGVYYAILTVVDDSGAVSMPSTVIVIVNPPVESAILSPSG